LIGQPLGKDRYLATRRTLAVGPRTPVSLAVLATIGAGTALGWWLSARTSWPGRPAYILSQVLLATAFFQAFALMHECGHGTASASPALNVVIGHLTSLGCFLPFYPWRYIHQEHHRWTGNLARDPTLGAVRRWLQAGDVPVVVRWCWRAWIPLSALVQHLVFLSYPLRMARNPATPRRQLWRCAASVLFLAAAYAALAAIVRPAPGRFLPALVIYLLAAELVNLPHHVGAPTTDGRLPVWEQWHSTRSCVYPPPLAWFCVLNFNLHVEHHTFPSLPWYRLPAARHLLRPALGARYQQEIGIEWSLRNRRRPLDTVIRPDRG
jgi:acyl-lipid omega-6 desaturase (Delta-12 desaturase)